MNRIINKFLSSGDKFMPEMHLKQPEFTYSACGPFTKNKESIKRFKETRDSRYIYQNELDKACFRHDMAYGDFKDLNRRTIADKVLHDKAFNIEQIQNMTDINVDLLQQFINFLIKTLMMEQLKLKSFLTNNQQKSYTNQLLEKLRKENYIHFLQTIFWAHIEQIFNSQVNLVKEFDFYYVLLTLIANMHGLFL